MKKILVFLFIALMAIGVCCACSKQDSDIPAPSDSVSKNPALSGSVSEKGELKTITLKVIDKDGSSKELTVETTKKELGPALKEKGIIAGQEGEYGLFVDTVNGITVDASKQEWWCLTKGGESVMTGVDTTPIEDGDTFEWTLTEGY